MMALAKIKIVAAVVREMGFTRRDLGQIIVASAICEDSIGWVIIAITLSLAQSGSVDLLDVGKAVLGTAAFLIASFTIGRPLVFFLIRWTNDNFESDFPVITTILVIMGLMALTTHFIGVHTVLGAFVAGVLIGESPILTKHIDEQLRGLILAFFMPVFFGIAGLSADLTVLKEPPLLLMALGLIAIATLGKFAGAFIGGEIGGLGRRESFALACGMNARGSTEVIVATIGLSMGALSQNLFTMIVAMAVVTTMAMPPMLRWALARVPLRKAEKERLEREEFEARGFVANLERLLVIADESPNGSFASRIAGLLAGARGLPVTILPPSATGGSRSKQEPKPRNGKTAERVEEAVKAAAKDTTSTSDSEPAAVDITIREHDKPTEEAVAKEATKGYDLLVLGVANTRDRNGEFHQDIYPHRRGLPWTARTGRGARRPSQRAGAQSTAHPRAGERDGRVTPCRRGGDRYRTGQRQCDHRALRRHHRREQRAQSQAPGLPRQPPGAGHREGDRRNRQPLRRNDCDGHARGRGPR